MREDHLRANARAVESSRFTSTEQALMRRRLLCEPAASGA